MSAGSKIKTERPRLLIVEHDQAALSQLLAALQRPCCERLAAPDAASADGTDSPTLSLTAAPSPFASPRTCLCLELGRESACCTVVGRLAHLHESDLGCFDAAICSTSLPDGSGLDALAYVRGTRPELPVVLLGTPGDATLASEAIRGGALDFIVATSHDLRMLPLVIDKCLAHQHIKEENLRLQADLSRSLADLAVTNKRLKSVISQLETMARTDDLTGLSNRRWLNLMLEGGFAEATRHDLPLAFLMIDLDGFKSLNDKAGHLRGDDMLRLAAKVILANCRQVDVPARYGGDEFCVLMSHTEPHEAVMVANRIMREFDHAIEHAPDRPTLSMSIGVAHVNLSRPRNTSELINHADEAMYAAKAAGKHCIMVRDRQGVFTPSES